MYGKPGQFNATKGAAQGMQNAMTATTQAMNQAGRQGAKWSNTFNRLRQAGAPTPQAASAGNLNGMAADAGPMNVTAASAGPINVTAYDAQLGEAQQGFRDAMGFQAGQIGQTDLGQYMNPYQQQVIDNSTRDLNRARQMAQGDIAGRAAAAGAFGGSRHGLVEAENNRNFAQTVADLSAQQRAASFDNAQNMAQQDIQNRMQGQQMRTDAAGQLGNMNLSDASRRDNVNLTNVQNRITNASRLDSVAQNNVQNRLNNANRLDANTQANIGNRLSNASRIDAVRGRNASNRLTNRAQQLAAAQAGQSAQAQNRSQQLAGAGQLAGMAGQSFNQANSINQTMAQQGAQQQMLQQQLIDAAKGQYGGFVGAPQNALNLPLMAVGATPNVGTQTTTQSGGGNGLFDALGFGASLLPFL